MFDRDKIRKHQSQTQPEAELLGKFSLTLAKQMLILWPFRYGPGQIPKSVGHLQGVRAH